MVRTRSLNTQETGNPNFQITEFFGQYFYILQYTHSVSPLLTSSTRPPLSFTHTNPTYFEPSEHQTKTFLSFGGKNESFLERLSHLNLVFWIQNRILLSIKFSPPVPTKGNFVQIFLSISFFVSAVPLFLFLLLMCV